MQQNPLKKRTKTPDEALQALMRLCARAEKSSGDALRLMRGWGVADADAEKVLVRLVADRFVDDERYAAAFVREKMNLSGWGEYKIRAALERKRIPREIISCVLAETDRGGMAERLLAQLQRKMRTAKAATPYELKTKLVRYGLSLGYDYAAVMETASKLVTNCDSCDDF